MEMLGWIIVGLLVGALFALAGRGRDAGGIAVAMLIGMAGALFAGFLGRLARLYEPGMWAGIGVAAIGSVGVLSLYRLLTRRG